MPGLAITSKWGDARRAESLRTGLLICGIASSALYPAADIYAAALYPGYSYTDQAVSELFAIGAPTSRLVVVLFTLSSALLLLFATGVWISAGGLRVRVVLAVMIAGNALDSLVLWNFFPMHMRGVTPTLTDTMHGLLAINPFVLAAIVAGAVAFRGWFRFYSIATIAIALVLAILGFSHAVAVMANQPTPGLGLTERGAQYANACWLTVLAIVLVRERSPGASRS